VLDLDTRKQEILKAVIHAYIHDAEPVGSERIAHRLRLHVSPATIRNEMAALEGRGRVLVRSSGTEPLVRLMVEAPSDEECEAILERLSEAATRELA